MLAALVAPSFSCSSLCILLVASKARQPSRQSAYPGGRPRLLCEPRSEAVLTTAVDWRDLFLQASVGARAPDNGKALPVRREPLVEITPPMQPTPYQVRLCDRPRNR